MDGHDTVGTGSGIGSTGKQDCMPRGYHGSARGKVHCVQKKIATYVFWHNS